MKASEMPWPRGKVLLDIIRKDTDKVLLAFSRGKDSLAAWLALLDHGFEVIPIHFYRIPGLGFVEASLNYYEDFFKTRIIRVPHPATYRQLNNFVFQPPSHISLIYYAGLPNIGYEDLRQSIVDDLKLPKDQWLATGVRAVDNPQRLMAVKKYGPIRKNTCTFWPVWDMKKDDLVALIRRHGVKLPEEYRYFGRSFDGIDFRYLNQIKKHWPEDYAKILQWFPLAELELKRYEFHVARQKEKHHAAG